MSSFEDKIDGLIRQVLPSYRYITQHCVQYNNTKLFFDFYIPDLKLIIEVQGNQHYQFNKFFFKDKKVFRQALHRDNLKRLWAANNGLELIELTEKEVEAMTPADFLKCVSKERSNGPS